MGISSSLDRRRCGFSGNGQEESPALGIAHIHAVYRW